jgi:hypothetical protein
MVIGNSELYEGAVKPTSIEQAGFEPDLWASRITDIPSNMQKRLDYDVRTDDNAVYIGAAPRGLAESADGWLLYYLEYDASDRLVKLTVAYDSWDNHATTAVYA